ncbi:DUF6030 family protein [Pseudomonas sp.]|uniref:DUF6030 family protein n=1 Tax=Pseudomonas sp. TaxID=306 RepID=UPI002896A5EE|nr:DUF6030 family protein [Pseudomonas sp.]
MSYILGSACLIWGIFGFYYYKAAWARRRRNEQYKLYADAVMKAVGKNFGEMKTRKAHFVKDLGYDNVDDSAWTADVEEFVTFNVLPELPKHTRTKLNVSNDMKREFSILTYNFVIELSGHDQMPATYDLKELIDSIERQGEIRTLVDGRPLYKPRKEIAARLAILVIAIGGLSLSDVSSAAQGIAFAPVEACNALAEEEGFAPQASGYSVLSEQRYSCATIYNNTPGGSLPNNFSLYAKGSHTKVTRVRVMLNVNQRSNAGRDTKELGRLCALMVMNLTGSAPAGLSRKVAAGAPFSLQHDGYRVYLEKTSWPTGRGYELNCAIATADHKE